MRSGGKNDKEGFSLSRVVRHTLCFYWYYARGVDWGAGATVPGPGTLVRVRWGLVHSRGALAPGLRRYVAGAQVVRSRARLPPEPSKVSEHILAPGSQIHPDQLCNSVRRDQPAQDQWAIGCCRRPRYHQGLHQGLPDDSWDGGVDSCPTSSGVRRRVAMLVFFLEKSSKLF